MRGTGRATAANRYTAIFIALILAIVCTIVVISLVFSMNFERTLTDQALGRIRADLSQLEVAQSSLNRSVRELAMQIFFDNTVRSLFFALVPTDTQLRDGTDQLENYRYSSSAVESIYLLNRATATVYVSSDAAANKRQTIALFYDRDLFRLLGAYDYDQPLVPVPRRIPLGDKPDSVGLTYDGFTYLFYDFANPGLSQSVVAVNVSRDLIGDVLDRLDRSLGSITFAVDGFGRLALPSPDRPWFGEAVGWVGGLAASLPAGGFVTSRVDGVDAYAGISAPDGNGWRWVSVTPLVSITDSTRRLRNQVLGIAAAILVSGLLVAVFFSWRLYAPLRIMVLRIRAMESEGVEIRRALRSEQIRAAIEGSGPGDAGTVRRALESAGHTIAPDTTAVLILVRIDSHAAFVGTHGAHDRGLIMQDIAAIARACAPKESMIEWVEMGEGRTVLLEIDPPQSRGDDIGQWLGEVGRQVEQRYVVGLSFVVAPRCSLDELPFRYGQALDDAFYRFFCGHRSIITSQTTERFVNTDLSAQENLESQLVSALMLGSFEEAGERYMEIVALISTCTAAVAGLALSHLVFTIRTAVQTLQRNNFPGVPIRPGVVASPAEFETVEEMNEAFLELFTRLSDLLDQRRQLRHGRFAERVTAIVERDFGKRDFCLKSMAAELGVTPNYVSRLFHRVTGTSVTDFITEARMREARRLLADTRCTIAEVSSRVGFTNDGYFYKAFKRHHGVTPAEYRRNAHLGASG